MSKEGFMLKERVKVFFIHLLFSLFLFFISLYFVFYIWYPLDLRLATGVFSIYVILIFVDFVLGPILTSIVYKKDKLRMCIDVMIIIALQMSAFFYGLHILEKGRPAWLVFVIDDIEIVSKSDIKTPENLWPKQFNVDFFEKPKWVSAYYSNDLKIAQQQKEDEIFNGVSLAQKPETFYPIEKKQSAIIKKLNSLDKLKEFNSEVEILNTLDRFELAKGWLPVKASNLDMVALFSKNGEPLAIVNLRPWK